MCICMAVHYKRASDAQRARFAEAFKNGLVRTYAKALLEFSDEQIEVLPETKPPRDPKKQMVKMEVRSSSGKVYPAVYAMRLYDDAERNRVECAYPSVTASWNRA